MWIKGKHRWQGQEPRTLKHNSGSSQQTLAKMNLIGKIYSLIASQMGNFKWKPCVQRNSLNRWCNKSITNIYIYIYMCVCVCACVCMYICIYIYMYVCIYVYIYICMYVYMYVCIMILATYFLPPPFHVAYYHESLFPVYHCTIFYPFSNPWTINKTTNRRKSFT